MTGYTGYTGYTGPNITGATGPSITGTTGPIGVTGYTGPIGPSITGSTGPIGIESKDNLTISTVGGTTDIVAGGTTIGTGSGQLFLQKGTYVQQSPNSWFMNLYFSTYWEDNNITLDISDTIGANGRITFYQIYIDSGETGTFGLYPGGQNNTFIATGTINIDRLDGVTGNSPAMVFVSGIIL
jgi:hypothetical protein